MYSAHHSSSSSYGASSSCSSSYGASSSSFSSYDASCSFSSSYDTSSSCHRSCSWFFLFHLSFVFLYAHGCCCWCLLVFVAVLLLLRWVIFFEVSGPFPLKLFLLKCWMIISYYDVVAWLYCNYACGWKSCDIYKYFNMGIWSAFSATMEFIQKKALWKLRNMASPCC